MVILYFHKSYKQLLNEKFMIEGETYEGSPGKNYFVRNFIGGGGEAKVFTVRSLNERGKPIRVAKHFNTPLHDIAIKFEEERDTLRTLGGSNGKPNYPGAVTLYDSNKNDFFLILEYVEGGSLEAPLDMGGFGSFELADAVQIIRSASGTLADIFEGEGIAHRDVKPGNMLLGDCIKFCDFTLALKKNRNTGKYESPVYDGKKEGSFLGTPNYCSPEIVSGGGKGWEEWGDERSDVWSLGVISYEMLTKEGAFPRTSGLRRLLKKISLFKGPRTIEEDLGGFEKIIYEMMQRRPEDRPCSREVNSWCSEFEKKLRGN